MYPSSDPSGNYPIFYKEEVDRLAKDDPDLSVKEAAVKADQKAKEKDEAYKHDPIFYRGLLGGLVIIVLVVVLGSIYLIGIGKTPTDGIIAIGSGAVGALIGLFSNK